MTDPDKTLISCIMPTYNRRRFVPQAIAYFLRQDHEPKELIIVDDGTDAIADLVPEDRRIRYVRLNEKATIGAKRNLACEQARGDVIVHWDDDDWMADWRLRYQASALLRERAEICGLSEVLFFDPSAGHAWKYVYSGSSRRWVYGATLCYTREFWKRNPFPPVNAGEDSRFIWNSSKPNIFTLEKNTFMAALVHGGNTCPKRTADSSWHRHPLEQVQGLIGTDWAFYAGTETALPVQKQAPCRGTALVSAAYGIGDILRITPLIRVFRTLGYQVDALLAPDYPETASLLEGAPDIRRVICAENFRATAGQRPLLGLDAETYDVAAFTTWSAPLKRWVKASRTYVFERSQWLREGDIACVKAIAREAGWDQPLPEPFVVSSSRRFGLPPGTIVLHPGCKPDWPWKKWHGYDDLARLVGHAVVIGMAADRRNDGTYFRKDFAWPDHVQDFTGNLGLRDTAALLRECSALVTNDSGMMHLGVAAGIPTFGVFGITSPAREMIPSKNMIPVTKGLACEARCREQSWGRRDCEQHLECLRALTPREVLDKICETVPGVPDKRAVPIATGKESVMEDLGLIYYGNVFDASGYGHAARAYIYALHKAGVQLSVVDLANHPRQVRDELVESLIGRHMSPDFHLFHGIPSYWAHQAFRLKNVIAMTVWETDTMPSQWRNALNHAMEVWVPCEYNVTVFSRDLEKPVFRLPHPALLHHSNGNGSITDFYTLAGIRDNDFVFYSIFEWQDRKSPLGTIESFLRAFPHGGNVVLVIKANTGAAGAALQTLEQARQATGSSARVEIRCEGWSETQMDGLHRRGNCYVSLHRGEGWCYPLFEAATRGTPVIATNYSGPADYLKTESHELVPYELRPVRQRYAYYNPRMRWAEPDLSEAAERMRSVYQNYRSKKAKALSAAETIRQQYSLESVGSMARERLIHLLKRTQPEKGNRLWSQEKNRRFSPAIPIAPEWYDADYYEHGMKSNWSQGYTWRAFSGLFTDTARFLTGMFPEASSFLDVGCAKGFLIRALREQGKECWGVEHSRWAVDQSEEMAKQYIVREGVDTARFDRSFDLMLAFSIFESLTEEQALSFLTRSRAWVRHALVAIISSFESEREEQLYKANDNDLSHILIRSRQWWHQLFLRAGWKQDPLHKVVERVCQEHELSQKMKWQLFVYSP